VGHVQYASRRPLTMTMTSERVELIHRSRRIASHPLITHVKGCGYGVRGGVMLLRWGRVHPEPNILFHSHSAVSFVYPFLSLSLSLPLTPTWHFFFRVNIHSKHTRDRCSCSGIIREECVVGSWNFGRDGVVCLVCVKLWRKSKTINISAATRVPRCDPRSDNGTKCGSRTLQRQHNAIPLGRYIIYFFIYGILSASLMLVRR